MWIVPMPSFYCAEIITFVGRRKQNKTTTPNSHINIQDTNRAFTYIYIYKLNSLNDEYK